MRVQFNKIMHKSNLFLANTIVRNIIQFCMKNRIDIPMRLVVRLKCKLVPMKTFLRFFILSLITIAFSALHVNAQKCNELFTQPVQETYTIPSPLGSITASALLAENNLSKPGTFSDCTILISGGANFEIDVPLALTEVTLIAGNGSGIIVNGKQILVVTSCKLISERDNHWNGISLEDNTSGLYLENNEISNVFKNDESTAAKDKRMNYPILNSEFSK